MWHLHSYAPDTNPENYEFNVQHYDNIELLDIKDIPIFDGENLP